MVLGTSRPAWPGLRKVILGGEEQASTPACARKQGGCFQAAGPFGGFCSHSRRATSKGRFVGISPAVVTLRSTSQRGTFQSQLIRRESLLLCFALSTSLCRSGDQSRSEKHSSEDTSGFPKLQMITLNAQHPPKVQSQPPRTQSLFWTSI